MIADTLERHLLRCDPIRYRLAAHLGILPDTCEDFTLEMGEQIKKGIQTRTTIAYTIREQTYRMFRLFWRLDRESKLTTWLGKSDNSV